MFGWRLDNKIHDEVNERHPEGETDKEQKKRLSQGNSIKKNEAWKRREGDNDVRKYIVQETEIILLILSLTKRSSSSKEIELQRKRLKWENKQSFCHCLSSL